MKNKYLWRIYLYSRYGITKTIGFIWFSENIPLPCINSKYPGKRINGQPTTLSFDLIKIEEE